MVDPFLDQLAVGQGSPENPYFAQRLTSRLLS